MDDSGHFVRTLDRLDGRRLARLWQLGDGSDSNEPADADQTVDEPGLQGAPLIEGYRLVQRLGSGGMGTVWRAVQLGTRRQGGLKLMGTGGIVSRSGRLRFEREVELAARLNHRGIARVFDTGLHKEVYFYAMELVRGLPLDEYVARNHCSRQQILELMRMVCQAIQHAHQKGVIHRDIKPSNILVTSDGQPHILDFGLAKAFGEEERGLTMSMDGDIAGTPAYMAPEQAAGRLDQIDTRSDVYSLGVVLYRLLTGQYPRAMTGGKLEVLRRIAEEEIRRPRDLRKGIDGDLEAILLKAMALEPSARYASAAELGDDLERYLRGDLLAARAATVAYFLRKKMRKHWVAIALTVAVAGAIVGTVVASYVRVLAERDRAEAQAERNRRIAYASSMAMANEEYYAVRFHQACLPLLAAPADLRGWEWYHQVSRITYPELTIWRFQNGNQRAVAVGPEGRWIAGAAEDGLVRVWDARTGTLMHELYGFAPQGDWKSYHQMFMGINVISDPQGRHLVAFSAPFGVLSIWNARTWQHEATWAGAAWTRKPGYGRFNDVSISPDGNFLAITFADDQRVGLWDLGAGRPGPELKTDFSPLYSRYSPDGGLVAVMNVGTVQIFDARTFQPIKTIATDRETPSPGGPMPGLAFSPHGDRMVVSDGRCARIWNLEKGKSVSALLDPESTIGSVGYSPDGNWIVSAGVDGLLRVWEANSGRLALVVRGQPSDASYAAFMPDGGRLVSSSSECIAVAGIDWARDGMCGRNMGSSGRYVYGGDISADGNFVIYANGPEYLVFDAHTGQDLRHPAAGYECTRIACNPTSGQFVVMGSGRADIFDVSDWRLVKSFGHGVGVDVDVEPAGYPCYSPDGKRLALPLKDNEVRVWNTATWDVAYRFQGKRAGFMGLFSPDGTKIACAFGKDITVFDLATQSPLAQMCMSRGVMSMAFSPDSRRVAASGAQDSFIFDASTGRTLAQMPGNAWAMSYTPDGRRLALGVGDVMLFDAETGANLMTLRVPHTRELRFLKFSPDGNSLFLRSRSSSEAFRVLDSGDHAGAEQRLKAMLADYKGHPPRLPNPTTPWSQPVPLPLLDPNKLPAPRTQPASDRAAGG